MRVEAQVERVLETDVTVKVTTSLEHWDHIGKALRETAADTHTPHCVREFADAIRKLIEQVGQKVVPAEKIILME